MRKEHTVSYRRDPGSSPSAAWRKCRAPQLFPFIRLSGKWLGRLGFSIGTKIEVEASPGRLVLRAVPASRSSELACEVCEPEGA